ncbi:MAG TPA: cell division protein SepF [Acholeplasma sp.]|jgi:cell division inhibitor SepF
MCLFRKKKPKETVIPTSEKIYWEQIKNDDDAYITELARKMMAGSPLILNFEALNVDRANKVIAFLSGVVFGVNGHILGINDMTYLFGNQSCYDDGSLEAWLDANLN